MTDKHRSIIHQGAVKVLGSEYQATWNDTELILFSDASLEYKMNNATKSIKLGPTTTATNSIRVNYPEVFVVNTTPEYEFSSTPMFSAEDAQGAKDWINKINSARILWVINTSHSHPLTRATCSSSEYNGALQTTAIFCPEYVQCKLCKTQTYSGFACEYCDEYMACEPCQAGMQAVMQNLIKSPTHEHMLMRFERANDPLFFNSNYDGTYNCDECKNAHSGLVYHCVECGIYDECPSCATGIKKPMSVAHAIGNLMVDALTGKAPLKSDKKSEEIPANQMHLELKHLASAMNVNGNSFSLKSGVKIPIGSSMISNRSWDLSEIEKKPTPNAYMEVTFTKFAPNSFVGVGIGNQIWVQNQMLGLQQNSYGYFNDGSVSHNVFAANEQTFFPGSFTAGDTVGIGMLFDSFKQRRLFFTKNGKMLGSFPTSIHKGMDCFPGVSFKNDSDVSFTVEMNGPFKFDLSSIPDYRNDNTDRMKSVPAEITAGILSYVATTARLALELRFVSKSFSEVACDNTIWKPLFLTKWPMQHSKLKLKSWYTLYKRRTGAQVPVGLVPIGPGGSTKTYIENCDFEFQCPLLWEAMTRGSNENERFCNKCQKTVYSVDNEAKLHQYAEMGRCVSLVIQPKFDFPQFPPHPPLAGAPRPPPRTIPPPPRK